MKCVSIVCRLIGLCLLLMLHLLPIWQTAPQAPLTPQVQQPQRLQYASRSVSYSTAPEYEDQHWRCYNRAQKALRRLRTQPGSDNEQMCLHFRANAKGAECTLEELGTSEEELRQHEIVGAKLFATELLQRARSGKYDHMIGTDLYLLHVQIRKASLSLEELGTSETELQTLETASDLKRAEKYLAELRAGDVEDSTTALMLDSLLKRSVSHDDLGTTEEEISIYNTWRDPNWKNLSGEYVGPIITNDNLGFTPSPSSAGETVIFRIQLQSGFMLE